MYFWLSLLLIWQIPEDIKTAKNSGYGGTLNMAFD